MPYYSQYEHIDLLIHIDRSSTHLHHTDHTSMSLGSRAGTAVYAPLVAVSAAVVLASLHLKVGRPTLATQRLTAFQQPVTTMNLLIGTQRRFKTLTGKRTLRAPGGALP